ncbi:Tn3 family transposase [Streptomyces liangshanensis]|uniref:Tn3 family transposase n=1 Tax=Streptomyces liangshanensis TaxID=2717324 RepID=UPI0036DE9EF0
MIITFVKGTNMGPHEAARHIPGVSGHELSYVTNKHFSIVLLNEAVADLVNAHARLDVSQAWGDGTAVAADETYMDTYLDNLLPRRAVRLFPIRASTISRSASRIPSSSVRGIGRPPQAPDDAQHHHQQQ